MENNSVLSPEIQAKRTKFILPAVTLLSGLAALIYESLWMRSFGLIFGNTTNAVTLILATYMGGIAFGSYLAGKVNIKNSLKAYIFIEAAIGLTALLTYILLKILPGFWGSVMSDFNVPVFELIMRILITSIIVFMPTILLGATMPFLIKELSYYKSSHAALSQLYSINTMGGVLGVILSTYFLLPNLGMFKTYSIAIAVNLIIAFVCSTFLTSASKTRSTFFEKDEPEADSQLSNTSFYKKFWIASFITAVFGATSFGLEILWTRSFVLVIGSSVYAFGVMLFTILVGIVVGSWIFNRFKDKVKNEYRLLTILLSIIAVSILLSSILTGWLPVIYLKLMTIFPAKFGVHQLLGFFLCFTTTFVITIIFGFAFPLVFNFSKKMSEHIEPSVTSARLYAWNTFGAIMGALITGFIIVPVAGIQKGFVLITALPVVSVILLLFLKKELALTIKYGITIALLALIIVLVRFWAPWDELFVTSGVYRLGVKYVTGKKIDNYTQLLHRNKKLLFYKEGVEGVVAVVENNFKQKYFSVNGKTDGGTSDLTTQKLLSYVPLALHPDPKSVFIIGWGTGCTAGAAGVFPIKSLDVAEIEPALIDCQYLFEEINYGILKDPRLHMIINDARNSLLTSSKKYDVIISEPSNPWISGISNLFTKDFYDIIYSHLEENGIFCQWFHVYDMSIDNIKSQVGTFCSKFPASSLWFTPPTAEGLKAGMNLNGDILLIGSKHDVSIDLARIQALFKTEKIKKDMQSLGIESPFSFISNEVLNRNDMLDYSKNADINTDDNLLIESNAPKTMFRTDNNFGDIYASFMEYDRSTLPTGISVENINNKDSVGNLYEELGTEYFNKNYFGKAYRALKEAFKYKRSEATANMIAQMYLLRQDLKAARKWYTECVTIDPYDLESWNQIAIISFHQDEMEVAKKVNEQIIKIFPKKPDGALGLGMIYYKEGNFDKASEYLKKAIKLDPNNELANKTLKQIEYQIKEE